MNKTSTLQRLRAAKLRPTTSRIAILQVVEAAGLQAVSAEEVFQHTIHRGTRMCLGTVYRALQEFEQRGLVWRDWDAGRKIRYRLKSDETQEPAVYLVCRHSGRRHQIMDPVLNECLQAAVSRLGLTLAGRQIVVEVEPRIRVDGLDELVIVGGALPARASSGLIQETP